MGSPVYLPSDSDENQTGTAAHWPPCREETNETILKMVDATTDCSANSCPEYPEQDVEMQKCAISEQKNSTSLRSKSAIYVQQNSIPEDLAKIVDAWTRLPDGVKSSIMAMIYAAVPDSD